MSQKKRTHVCFVTGSRAEFGLMERALGRLSRHPNLRLSIIATGMHLDRAHGNSVAEIRRSGWKVDAVVPWRAAKSNRGALAAQTGKAITGIAGALKRLDAQIVLVVGDRVEALAAATAGHLSGLAVAHVHGGDRALGQVDDSIRHAVTKLSHVHFAATRQSADRLVKLGEDPWRVHCTGSPALDDIASQAAGSDQITSYFPGLLAGQFALLALHPACADDAIEYRRARTVLRALKQSGVTQIAIVYPNNDPGAAGIIRCWEESRPPFIYKNLPRQLYLALLRGCAFLIGNSSSGIIEAASFHKRVIDIGPRQSGRERCDDVTWSDYRTADIKAAIGTVFSSGHAVSGQCANPYGDGHAGARMADILGRLKISPALLSKQIAY